MKVLLRVICVILVPVVLLAVDNPSIVKMNLQLKHYGKRTRVFVDNLERPFSVGKNGLVPILVNMQDSINIEIHSYGYQKREITFFPRRIPVINDTPVISAPPYSVDFINDPYYGEKINEAKFKDPYYLNYYKWIVGKVCDSSDQNGVEGVKVGIISINNSGMNYYTSAVTTEDGEFCIPLEYSWENKDYGFFVAVLKEGYLPSIEFFSQENYNNYIEYDENKYLYFKNLDITKTDDSGNFLTLVPLIQKGDSIKTLQDFQVINKASSGKILNINRNCYSFINDTLSAIDVGIFKEDIGFSRVVISKKKDTLYVDQIVHPDQIIPVKNSFSSFLFVPLKYSDVFSEKRMQRVMDGSIDFSGIVVDRESGRILPHSDIILNNGERILTTDTFGRFRFEKLLPEKYKAHISRKGYRPKKFKLNPEEDPYLKLQLKPIPDFTKSAITGTILTYKRLFPIEDLELYLNGIDCSTITDENGYFRFDNLPEGGYTLKLKNNPDAWFIFNVPPDSIIVETLVLNREQKYKNQLSLHNEKKRGLPRGTLSGVVEKDISGDGIKDVEVILIEKDLKTTTNVFGEFRFWNLPTGYYDIIFKSENYQTTILKGIFHDNVRSSFKSCTLIKKEVADSLERIIIAAPQQVENYSTFSSTNWSYESAEIGGYAFDVEERKPLSGASASLVGTSHTAAIELNGEFAIKDIEPGTYTLEITAPGYKKSSRKISIKFKQHLYYTFQLENE